MTSVTSSDLGQYSCVAINNGGMAERNVTLTFTHPGIHVPYPQKLTIIIAVAAGALFVLIIFIIVLCCVIRSVGDINGFQIFGEKMGN